MKTGKYLHYMNYENIKMFICSTWIMKIFVCNAWIMKMSIWNTWIMKIGKYLFAINELWKNENVCLQNMNYENILFKIHELWINFNVCSQCMNYEDIFCNTWIIKIRKCCLHYMNYEKNENVCSQCMNYENIFLQ